MTRSGERASPTLVAFDGGPSLDGKSLRVEATTGEGGALFFTVPFDSMTNLIAFLLIWASATGAKETRKGVNGLASPGVGPIPATSVSVPPPNGGEGFIGISVGQVELAFSMPLWALPQLGHTLMLAAPAANTTPS